MTDPQDHLALQVKEENLDLLGFQVLMVSLVTKVMKVQLDDQEREGT